ncbi:Phosphoglycolate phosphatase [Candidatus Tiddalikarchaeum anstoanum]|nr:Phosphoglycolate phosphatase [Candidatus Tiddalikarchaeum anstoanum]
MIKLVCIDIDGTATDGPDHPLRNQEKLADVIKETQKRGSIVYFVTGRGSAYVKNYLSTTEINASALCEMGAVHYSNSHAEPLSSDSVKSFMEIRGELEKIIESGLKGKYKQGWGKEGKEVMLTYNDHTQNRDISTMYRLIVSFLEKYNDKVDIMHSQTAVDVVPKGLNKAFAIRNIMEKYGIDGEIAAIGDSNGDKSMLDIADFVGAPQNAEESIKELVRERKERGFISDKITTHGTCDFLRKLLALEYFTTAMDLSC